MSVTLAAAMVQKDERPHVRPMPLPTAILIGLGSLACFAVSWQHLVEVWRTGTFFDTDDAMRLVQVRAWLAGQGWFDMTAYRLDPPAGVFMHWSRIVDVPLGLLIRFFALFTSMAQAELLTRIVFPLTLQVLMVAAFLYAGRALCGHEALLPALILVVLSGFQFGQFVAGRIDHHAPQIVLLVTMTGGIVSALRGAGRHHAALAALCMALSLGISLENLPFIAILIATVAVLWLIRGETVAGGLAALGIGVAVCVPVVFVMTVAPARYGIASADSLSGPHVLFALLGGLWFVALARLRRAGRPWLWRGAALAIAGLTTGGLVLLVYPTALTSPFAQIDPVVRDVWLSRVTEAMPLAATIRLQPQALTLVLAPLLAGLLAATGGALIGDRTEREGWPVVVALILIGLVGAAWEVRVTSSTLPIAELGGVWAVTRVMGGGPGKSGLLRVLRTCLMVLPFTPFAWLLVPMPEEKASVIQANENAAACREAAALTPLAALPPGIVFAPIDAGAYLLVHTRLAVLAGPYHRNNVGNRAVIDGFRASPTQAEALVKAQGARYVAFCPGEMQSAGLPDYAPDGLASRLLAGDVPPWLHALAIAGTPYRVYAVE